MDHRQWRPSPSPIQGNNVCPTCLFSHLPFCPPPGPPPSAYHPPPFQFQGDPNYTQSSFQFQAQPFSTSYARPYPTSNPNHNPNPNWDTQTFRPPYEHGNLGVGEGDRNFKRPRIDDFNQNPPLFNLSEDERRLKLIRDHGGADDPHHGYDSSRPVFPLIAAESGGAAAAGNNEMHNLQIHNGQQQDRLHNHNHNHNYNQNGFPSNLVHGRGEKDASAVQYGYGHGQPKTPPYPLDPQQLVPHPLSEPSYLPRRDSYSGLHRNGMNAPYPEHMGSGDPNKLLPQPYATQHPFQFRQEVHVPSQDGSQTQVVVGQQDMSAAASQRGMSKLNGRVVYHDPYAHPAGSSNIAENMGQMEASRFFRGQPPLPSSPPPPLPLDPPINQSSHLKTHFSPPKKPASLFPVPVSSSAASPSSYSPIPEAHSLTPPYFHSKPPPQFSTGFPLEEQSKQYLGDAQPFSLKQLSNEKPKFVDASRLFHHPHRTSRPDHFVIIFRGLPGSGKSYLAKMLRDLEVENGGDAPRIHSMDDYFMTEVEKVEDNDASKSSSGRNKKPVMKKVMEYCYEPEMEEAYRSSMLKAFKKTVEEGVFTFIIVDDRNLRVADFAQFWATAKRLGYEVYILEATYKDPAGCAARNVHGFTQEDIEKMAVQWEEAPSLYLQLDAKSLFHGDDLKESRIQEVDMDMEDDLGDALPAVQGREAEKVIDPSVRDDASSLKDGKRWDAEGQHPTEVRELGKSKWSEDLGEDDIDQTEGMKGNINALSGLIHQYGKERKSVHWGDQVGKTGFSIGAARKVNTLSLVIGPGAGYNLKSNPLPEEESPTTFQNSVEPKKHSIFEERIRAERESFRAVFDRRRQRIGGLDVEED